MQRDWATWMAVAGLAILGLDSILVAPASAALAAAVTGGRWLGLEAVLTQALLVGVLVLILAMGVVRGSRLAYVIALVIGVVPLLAWMSLVTTIDAMTIQRDTLRLLGAALMVVAGLGLSWPMSSAAPNAEETLHDRAP